ncbi:hypothetical protein D4R42_03750 [bacterium]|nr:MAG: hypothetical protein D4R42_03750 [bacterium]
MTDQTEVRIFERHLAGGSGYGLYYADVSTDDTVTLDNFDLIENAMIIHAKNSAVITFAKATNVLTITGVITSERVLIFAQGA